MPKRILFALLAMSIVTHAAQALGCAVCLSGADDAITHGYNASVLFLMATPYVVGGCIAAGLIFAYRRASARREQADESAPVPMAFKQEESSR